jgi:GTP pyrophosphokinase
LTDNGYPKIEDMFAAIGYGKLMARTPLTRFVPEDQLPALDQAKTSRLQQVTKVVKRALRLGDDRIAIKGADDVLVYRAPCCNPIRGEEIVGYITRGKGVGVHARRCRNVANLLVNRERIIEVTWEGEGSEPYAVKVSVITEDRQGQLAALTNAIANIKTNIRDARTDGDGYTDGLRRIDLTVDITDVKHLERVASALKGVEGVIEVEHLAAVSQNT